jgi:hypothetical protein
VPGRFLGIVAFVQKHTILHNVLSDNRLHSHKTVGQRFS